MNRFLLLSTLGLGIHVLACSGAINDGDLSARSKDCSETDERCTSTPAEDALGTQPPANHDPGAGGHTDDGSSLDGGPGDDASADGGYLDAGTDGGYLDAGADGGYLDASADGGWVDAGPFSDGGWFDAGTYDAGYYYDAGGCDDAEGYDGGALPLDP